MVVPVVVLLASAVLAWLSVFDRASPLAVALVEVETSFGFALWIPFTLAGGALLAARILGNRAPAPPPPARPLTRDSVRVRPAGEVSAPTEGAPWLDTLRVSARGVSDDPMGRIRFDDAAGVPIALVLTGVTREQARRRVAAYAAWLATIPAPPVARIRVVSSPDLEGPLHGLFRGELAKHFGAEAVRVASIHDGADAVFAQPDARWRA